MVGGMGIRTDFLRLCGISALVFARKASLCDGEQ